VVAERISPAAVEGFTEWRTMSERDAELATTFAHIARRIQAQDSRERTWQQIVDMAGDVLPAFEHAAISVVRRDQLETSASSDDVARQVDVIQREAGEGPCLSAIREHDTFVTGDLLGEDRWPRFARRTVEETGVRSMLAFQLFVEEDTLGSLNLFSERVDAFDDRAVALGGVLAAHAAVAMAAADERHLAGQLETALASNREIGLALGIMMAQAGIDRHRAFNSLSQASQRMNVKLSELAASIVADQESNPRELSRRTAG
jgi:transcriptional regulator with GAF, ATPase, and Fis domain